MVCVFLKNFKQQIVKHDPKNCNRQCNEVFQSTGNTRKCNKKASWVEYLSLPSQYKFKYMEPDLQHRQSILFAVQTFKGLPKEASRNSQVETFPYNFKLSLTPIYPHLGFYNFCIVKVSEYKSKHKERNSQFTLKINL